MINVLKQLGDYLGVTPANAEMVSTVGNWMVGVGGTLFLGALAALLLSRRSNAPARRPLKAAGKMPDGGFTLLELLTVIGIIIVLAALIIGGMSYAQQKAAASRATAEIAALGLMLGSFKQDHGEYPNNSDSDDLDPTNKDLAKLVEWKGNSALMLMVLTNQVPEVDLPNYSVHGFRKDQLSGEKDVAKVAVPFGPLKGQEIVMQYIMDPFGYPYGYSTKKVFNPTFDLWSTAGQTVNDENTRKKWVKNW